MGNRLKPFLAGVALAILFLGLIALVVLLLT